MRRSRRRTATSPTRTRRPRAPTRSPPPARPPRSPRARSPVRPRSAPEARRRPRRRARSWPPSRRRSAATTRAGAAPARSSRSATAPSRLSCTILRYPARVRRWGLHILAGVLALVLVGSLQAATSLADPIIGAWKVTNGGSGTLTVAERAGVLALTARGVVVLGCVREADGVLGFADLPSDTALPAGHYNANFGVSGQGCYYNVALTLARGVLKGRVVLSENDEPGGPFTFTKVGSSTYRWTVRTKGLNGSGTVTTNPQGTVTGASGA